MVLQNMLWHNPGHGSTPWDIFGHQKHRPDAIVAQHLFCCGSKLAILSPVLMSELLSNGLVVDSGCKTDSRGIVLGFKTAK